MRNTQIRSHFLVPRIEVMRGIKNKGNVFKFVITFDLTTKLITIHHRHEDIRDDEIGFGLFDTVQGIDSILGCGYLITLTGHDAGLQSRPKVFVWGAGIHDIGKIQIPAEILAKPGRLSDIEFSIVREHPKVGYGILKKVEFPWPVADIAHQHHERMEGSGYPQGLKGEAICPEARIVAVADVVEAMSSHRPHRPALGIDAALEEISANRGTLFDAQAVDACLRLFRDKGFDLAKT